MRPKLVLTVSALAVAATLAAIPAFAQNSGQGSAQQSQYPVGRAMNDGGFQAQSQDSNAQRTDAAENRGASTAAPQSTRATAQNSQYPIGRAMNDGGYQAAQSQSGSAQNTQQPQAPAPGSAGPTNFAYDPNGAGPYNGPGPYYNYAGGPSFMGGPVESNAIQACQARFRSYDPNTGTYLGFDGARHPCP